jgi:hypothetical protein
MGRPAGVVVLTDCASHGLVREYHLQHMGILTLELALADAADLR